GEEPFDCIFMDPPYRQGLEEQVLAVLKDASYVNEDTLIIVEASLDTDFSYLENYGFISLREKRYKTNMHVFIRKA
ncbi:MAG TPA: RsmD family RNA methyltransferase, partial [Candidatus Blautia avicola]|nr:RsmD family RNA methyltransferase [Candidatus Blautia avicola]